MSEYFLKPKSSGGWIRVKVELDFKNGTTVDTSDFAKKTDLANLKSDIYKLDMIN